MRVIAFKRMRLRAKLHRPESMREDIYLRRKHARIGWPDRRKNLQIGSRLNQSPAFASNLTSLAATLHHGVALKSP